MLTIFTIVIKTTIVLNAFKQKTSIMCLFKPINMIYLEIKTETKIEAKTEIQKEAQIEAQISRKGRQTEKRQSPINK